MSNQTEFTALINRINTATNTLEANVLLLKNAGVTVGEGVQQVAEDLIQVNLAVELIEQIKLDVEAVQQDVQTTRGVIEANIALSETQVQDALQAVTEAEQLVDLLLTSAPFQEAPINGKVFGRKDGQWEEIVAGDEVAVVTKVNGVEPDLGGNVIIDAAAVGAKSSTYVPSWDEVTGKPLFGSLAAKDEAPADSKQYARKDGEWSEVVIPEQTAPTWSEVTGKPLFGTMATQNDAASTATTYLRKKGEWVEFVAPEVPVVGAVPFPVPATAPDLDGDEWLEWIDANPHVPVALSRVGGGYSGGQYQGGASFFTPEKISQIPTASYSFSTVDFGSDVPVLQGEQGIIIKYSDDMVVAILKGDGVSVTPKYLTWSASNPNWTDITDKPVVEKGFKINYPIIYKQTTVSSWPELNPNDATALKDWTGSAAGVAMYDATGQPAKVGYLPNANYSFIVNDFKVGSPLRDYKGVITKFNDTVSIAKAVNSAGVTKLFSWTSTAPTWVEVAGESAGGNTVTWESITNKPTFGTLASQNDVSSTDGVNYVRRNASWRVLPASVPEAPNDANKYVREREGWTVLPDFLEDAPNNTTAYVRKGGVWVAETTGGGGSTLGHPIEKQIKYLGVVTNNWPMLNPNQPVRMEDVAIYYTYIDVTQWSTTSNEIWKALDSAKELPCGSYSFRTNTFSGTATGLTGKAGIIVKTDAVTATAFVNSTGTTPATAPEVYTWDTRSYKFQLAHKPTTP